MDFRGRPEMKQSVLGFSLLHDCESYRSWSKVLPFKWSINTSVVSYCGIFLFARSRRSSYLLLHLSCLLPCVNTVTLLTKCLAFSTIQEKLATLSTVICWTDPAALSTPLQQQLLANSVTTERHRQSSAHQPSLIPRIPQCTTRQA